MPKTHKEITKLKEKIQLDSSEVSSIDEYDDDDMISQKATDDYIKTELLEKIMKYFFIDTSIKEKQKEIREEMKALKDQKIEMENFILRYLESIEEEFVEINGHGKLIKKTRVTKGAIKVDFIKNAVSDKLKEKGLFRNENDLNTFVETILGSIDEKRPTTSKTFIQRSTKKDKVSQDNTSSKSSVKSGNKSKKIQNDSDEDLPTY